MWSNRRIGHLTIVSDVNRDTSSPLLQLGCHAADHETDLGRVLIVVPLEPTQSGGLRYDTLVPY